MPKLKIIGWEGLKEVVPQVAELEKNRVDLTGIQELLNHLVTFAERENCRFHSIAVIGNRDVPTSFIFEYPD